MPTSDVEFHTKNLRFRDNQTVFNTSARWLDEHRDEALPLMALALAGQGPEALGVARVMGVMGDPRAIPALEATLSVSDDRLAFEAARALARTPDDAAAAALRRAAGGTSVGVALRGIEARADASLCDAVAPHLDAEAPVGEYAQRAWKACGCEQG